MDEHLSQVNLVQLIRLGSLSVEGTGKRIFTPKRTYLEIVVMLVYASCNMQCCSLAF